MSTSSKEKLVAYLSESLKSKGLILATAESCTGGLIAAAITERAGSSAVFDRGFVTYSNQAKTDMLGVSAKTLAQYGAVSSYIAKEMADGALDNSNADLTVSVTGIAGPDGGTEEKPIGLVYIAVTTGGQTQAYENHFKGSREEIREQTVEKALELLIEHLKKE